MKNPVLWIVGGVVLLAAIYYFINATSGYLGARLEGPDVSTHFYRPIVRHVLSSQSHCYDLGDNNCEARGASKEFTIGYVFHQPPQGVASTRLWGCQSRNATRAVRLLTTDHRDCQTRRMALVNFGTIATTPAFEAPVTLVRCYDQGADNYLVTDDPRECELTAHTDEVVELGYVASAGHLPQRRLEGLCAAAEQVGAVSNARDIFCRNISE